jgi:hypothetical protein
MVLVVMSASLVGMVVCAMTVIMHRKANDQIRKVS